MLEPTPDELLARERQAARIEAERHEAFVHHTDELLALIYSVAVESADDCDFARDLAQLIRDHHHEL